MGGLGLAEHDNGPPFLLMIDCRLPINVSVDRDRVRPTTFFSTFIPCGKVILTLSPFPRTNDRLSSMCLSIDPVLRLFHLFFISTALDKTCLFAIIGHFHPGNGTCLLPSIRDPYRFGLSHPDPETRSVSLICNYSLSWTLISIPNRRAYYVARMSLWRGKTETFIAHRFNLSKAQVSRDVQHAVDKGLVRIDTERGECSLVRRTTLLPPNEIRSEDAVRNALALKDCVLVDPRDAAKTYASVATVAAWYLALLIRDGDIVAVGGGRTIEALLRALRLRKGCRTGHTITFVPLSSDAYLGDTSSLVFGGRHHAAHQMAMKYRSAGATTRLVQFPIPVQRRPRLPSTDPDDETRTVLDLISKATVVVSGVGHLEPDGDSTLRQLATVNEIDPIAMHHDGVVGEFSYHFFNREGKVVPCPLSGMVWGPRIEDIRTMRSTARGRLVVAVLADERKAIAAAAVLKAGMINTLVTSVAISRTILRYYSERAS